MLGGGVFGCTSALALAERGHDVTLFDRLPTLLGGASYHNQNRLHLGFHYPRDPQTAAQCQRGFARFAETFRACVVRGFTSAYFIAEEGSRTSPSEFMAFCAAQGLAVRALDPKTFSPRVERVALGVTTDEAVYDAGLLRAVLTERLVRARVTCVLGRAITAITRRNTGFSLDGEGGAAGDYDAVVNCTYADVQRLTASLGHAVTPRQYEYTAVAVVELDGAAPTGITVLDGPFMTVLPFGATGRHLLYHVEQTVIAREVAAQMDPRWRDPRTAPFAQIDRGAWFAAMVRRSAEFVPSLGAARLAGVLEGPRMVLAHRDATDARPSITTLHEPGYVTVFAGKVDHCLGAADEVVAHIEGRSAGA